MKQYFKDLPNMLTLGNLLCGLLGIMLVFTGKWHVAFWFMLAAGVLDFFDGFTARLLGVSGEMGKQLDSLADLVTFGVLPGLISWQLMEASGYCPKTGFCINGYVWLAFPLAAAWRLARFNIETSTTSGFKGVPTPISGIALASVGIAVYYQGGMSDFYTNIYVLKGMPLLMSMLMVSDLPMLAFKFSKTDKLLYWKLALLLIIVALVIVFKADSGPLIYVAYVFTSLLSNFVTKSSE
jgi:CDP-diacylglycerol--serine O-phosphatidyltransferase